MIFAPERPLGRTGFRASRIGIGDLADRSIPLEECVATVRRALDAGLNVIDTAPGYEEGYSEQITGLAVAGRRDGVFVIDKIDHLDRPVAPQVESSLKTLGLPRVDCFVFHAVSRPAEWRALTKRGGGMDQLAAERESGRVRFRGISSHDPGVLRAAILSGVCDVVLFAVGPACDSRYVDEILPLARERGVGVVGMKAFGAGKLITDTEGYGRPLRTQSVPPGTEPGLPRLAVAECLRYSLTCDPDVLILGLSNSAEQDEAFAAAHAFKRMTSGEMQDVRSRAQAALIGKGACWWDPQA